MGSNNKSNKVLMSILGCLVAVTWLVGIYALNKEGTKGDVNYEPDSIIVEYAEEMPLTEDKMVDYTEFADFQEYRYYRGTTSVNVTVLLTRYGSGLYLVKNTFNSGETSESVRALSTEDAQAVLELLKNYEVTSPSSDEVLDGSISEYAGIVLESVGIEI